VSAWFLILGDKKIVLSVVKDVLRRISWRLASQTLILPRSNFSLKATVWRGQKIAW